MKNIIYVIIFAISISFSQAQETGEFIITTTPKEILGSAAADNDNYIDSDALITWEVYVHDNYDAENPPGIMVYAKADKDVRPPVNWFSVLEEKNMIWVAPRKSRNGTSIYQKVLLAIMSVPLVEQRYSIDKNRIYIAGDSRAAARTALDYPDIIKGGIFQGDRIWEDNAEDKIQNALDNRYVFVSGNKTPIPRSNAYSYNKFKKAGVEKLEFIYLNGGGRINKRFDRRRLIEAIEFLDN